MLAVDTGIIGQNGSQESNPDKQESRSFLGPSQARAECIPQNDVHNDQHRHGGAKQNQQTLDHGHERVIDFF